MWKWADVNIFSEMFVMYNLYNFLISELGLWFCQAWCGAGLEESHYESFENACPQCVDDGNYSMQVCVFIVKLCYKMMDFVLNFFQPKMLHKMYFGIIKIYENVIVIDLWAASSPILYRILWHGSSIKVKILQCVQSLFVLLS